MTRVGVRARRSRGMRAAATSGANGRAVAPVKGIATRHTPSARARPVVMVLGDATPISTPHASAVATTNSSSQLQPRFCQCPRFNKTTGKNASVQRVWPRSRRMKTMKAAATAATTTMLKTMPTRKSGHSFSRPATDGYSEVVSHTTTGTS